MGGKGKTKIAQGTNWRLKVTDIWCRIRDDCSIRATIGYSNMGSLIMANRMDIGITIG